MKRADHVYVLADSSKLTLSPRAICVDEGMISTDRGLMLSSITKSAVAVFPPAVAVTVTLPYPAGVNIPSAVIVPNEASTSHCGDTSTSVH